MCQCRRVKTDKNCLEETEVLSKLVQFFDLGCEFSDPSKETKTEVKKVKIKRQIEDIYVCLCSRSRLHESNAEPNIAQIAV
jgi:hypothetical protein